MDMLHFPSHLQKQTRQERYVSCNIIWRHIHIFASWFFHLVCTVLIIIILHTVLKSSNIPTKSACLCIFTSTAFTEWIHCLETKDCWLAYGLQYTYSVNKQNTITVIHYGVRTYCKNEYDLFIHMVALTDIHIKYKIFLWKVYVKSLSFKHL